MEMIMKYKYSEMVEMVFNSVCDKYGIEFGKEVYDWPHSAIAIYFLEHIKGNYQLEFENE